MTIGFLRPVGASGDVKELEYISALHQTSPEIRQDGSITDEDIVNFLMSRYGIVISQEQVRKEVIQGLGGGDEEQDSCIDLMELTAILLIPTLLKAATLSELPQGVIRPRREMLDYVLSMILHDTTGSREPKRLDKRLIQRILVSYGEVDLATNEALIEEMLKSAQTLDGTLTVDAFSSALTHDVQLYDVRNEIRQSTNYDDVFLTRNHRDSWMEHDDEEGTVPRDVAQERRSLSKKLDRKFTAPAIDMVVGTFRSKSLIVLLWVAFVVMYFGYEGYSIVDVSETETCPEELREYQYGLSWMEQSRAMGCEISRSILQWFLTFFIVSWYGFVFIGLGSLGNAITCKRVILPVVAIFIILLGTVLPWTETLTTGTDYLQTVSVILGITICIFHAGHIIVMIVPQSWLEWTKQRHVLKHLFGSGVVLAESNIKQAGACKLDTMMRNALDLAEHKDPDAVLETHYGQSLLAFSRAGKKYKEAGGFLWTWKRIFNSEAFCKEGIWLSARLLASNMAQFIVTVFVLIAGIRLTQRVAENYDVEVAKNKAGEYMALLFNRSVSPTLVEELAANYSLTMTGIVSNSSSFGDICAAGNYTNVSQACELVGSYYICEPASSNDAICTLLDYSASSGSNADGLLALGLLNASGLVNADELLNTTEAALQTAADASVDSLYPAERYMVIVPCILGSLSAFATAVSLAITYIPSVTSTTLQLRTGVLQTLHDRCFNRYRVATDQVTLIIGSMFWGSIFASFVVGGLVGVIAFLFLWQATISYVQRFVAIVIGIATVVVIKLLFLIMCRIMFAKAYYRTRPAASNMISLSLECANFALSVGFIFLRTCKLLITSALFVGRIDTAFLAPGIGRVGQLELDNYPTIFLKDVLSHEAHRHPYIELMGVMYLMKLRYGPHFGSRAGSTWRLIFVYALMPWLSKYRVTRRLKDDKVVIDDSVGRESGVDDAPSSLMTGFVSLRTLYVPDQDDDILPPANLMRRSLTGRSSKRACLLLKELESEQTNKLEKDNAILQRQVVELHDQISYMQAEIERMQKLLQEKNESMEMVLTNETTVVTSTMD